MDLFSAELIVPILAMIFMIAGLMIGIRDELSMLPERRPYELAAVFVLLLSLLAGDLLRFFTPLDTCALVYEQMAFPAVIVSFILILSGGGQNARMIIAAVLNAVLCPGAFLILGPENGIMAGRIICLLTCHILLIYRGYTVVRDCPKDDRADMVIPLAGILVMLMAVWVGMSGSILPFFVPMAFTGAGLLKCLWLGRRNSRQHTRELIERQNVNIMVSQIRPHFIYNTLSTIQALCMTDPGKAFDTLEKFGIYLRQNISSMSQVNRIPFKEELEHTRVYADIEMIRFPRISLEYDIEDDDFSLPALTLQPVVENAIRHGVRIRKHGEVRISSRRGNGEHVIVVNDNGKGFDTSILEDMENSHVGIRNVRSRLELMCRGTMEISSRPGEGTCVTIRIPFTEGDTVEED